MKRDIMRRDVRKSAKLADVCYDIRGPVMERARLLEEEGHHIIKLNIGNLAPFGFDTPDEMRHDVIVNLPQASGYCDSKGLFSARKAIMHYTQEKDIAGVELEDIIIGNGVSELIVMSMQGLLDNGDEVLIPAPDYPLWTAAVSLSGGRPVHYLCDEGSGWLPDIDDIRAKVTPNTRAIVVINPNNPTGAVYGHAELKRVAEIAEQHRLVVFSDEIYDHMLFAPHRHVPMATLARHTLCATFSGLSKVYRACGLRVGWVSFSGERAHARPYLDAIELLASLRLCSNMTGQWAVQTALGGYQSINELVGPGGRLLESRTAVLEAVAASRHLSVVPPGGAMYAFLRVNTARHPDFDDERFALALLEQRGILVAPGSSFNVPYRDHFRITLLPDEKVLRHVIGVIDELLEELAS